MNQSEGSTRPGSVGAWVWLAIFNSLNHAERVAAEKRETICVLNP